MLRRIVTPLTYLLLAILLVGGTTILVAVGRGYGYNFKTHQLIFNGLVIMNSTPSGAAIKVNGKNIHRKTPYHNTLEAGQYNFEVTKDGYLPWSKQLKVLASSVTWAQYIILFPVGYKAAPLLPATAPVQIMAESPDRHHVAYLTAAPDPAVWMLTGDGHQSERIYLPKAATADQPAEVINEVRWSDDASHLLLRSTIGAKVSYLLISAAPGQPVVNLSDVFGFSFSNLQFNPSNWRELYWISPEGLRRLNVEAQTVSAVLADNVSAYTFGGDRLYYIATAPLGKSIFALDRNGHKTELIQSLPISDSYELDYSNYQGHDNLAVAPNQSNTVTLYRDVLTANPVAKVISKSANHLSFNDEGRILEFWSPAGFGSYDIDRDELSAVTAFGGDLTYIGWFDNYHLLINTDGKLIMTEYDGANSQTLDTAASGVAFGTNNSARVIWLGQVGASPSIMALDFKH